VELDWKTVAATSIMHVVPHNALSKCHCCSYDFCHCYQ